MSSQDEEPSSESLVVGDQQQHHQHHDAGMVANDNNNTESTDLVGEVVDEMVVVMKDEEEAQDHGTLPNVESTAPDDNQHHEAEGKAESATQELVEEESLGAVVTTTTGAVATPKPVEEETVTVQDGAATGTGTAHHELPTEIAESNAETTQTTEPVADDEAGGPEGVGVGVGVDGQETTVGNDAPLEPDSIKQGEVPPVVEELQQEEEEELGEPIEDPADMDVLSGRGAAVNSRPGNRKFRALCFAHKPHFEAGNHAAKRRIATEIVALMFHPTDGAEPSRFLKKRVGDRGPYYAMNEEQAILKAQQVMRDYKRPDRVAARELLAQNGNARKRTRQVESTPMIDVPVPDPPEEPIIENPFGVHAHDVLSGRGAFVNGHIGNERLRTLAQERKRAFDSGSYTEKRQLATEIVQIIRSLDPPGRFLKRVSGKQQSSTTESGKTDSNNNPEAVTDSVVPPENGGDNTKGPTGEGGIGPSSQQPSNAGEGNEAPQTTSEGGGPNIIDGIWEELSDEMSIHKTCQVMRDIARPDRKHREERRQERKRMKMLGGQAAAVKTDLEPSEEEGNVKIIIPEHDTTEVGAQGDDEVKVDGTAGVFGGDEEIEAVGVDGVPVVNQEIPEGDDGEAEGTKVEAEVKDVEMKDISSLAEKAAVEVVDKALDGTPSKQATMEISTDAGAIEV